MRTHARVVIIGGGIMGVSLLYHLGKRGWVDSVLIEKSELTSGSTWHAAGLCTHFSHNPTIMEMRATSVRLYRENLPEEMGQSVGFHPCGALRITNSRDRLDEFYHVRDLGRFVGQDFQILTLEELKGIYPLCQTGGLLGAFYEPNDGHIDPTLATNALANGARKKGAEIYRHTVVTNMTRTNDGHWLIETDMGKITAEHVVNAAGTWCREVGDMVGLDLPVVPMLHQYIVTDRVDAITTRAARHMSELPMIRDPEESWYMRQEGTGFIIGAYQKAGVPWSIDGVPKEFGMELLPPELDRVEDILEKAMSRVPPLAEAGIKKIVNGPITFTPDGNPLIGPTFGLQNAWLLTGTSMGIMEGGGAGAFLADWIIDGYPPRDPIAVDPRRFGDYADRAYRIEKAIECFGLQFGVHYPFEERVGGRPKRKTPAYERQCDAGAVFGCVNGWERPNWFAQEGQSRYPALSFRRSNWFNAVKNECQAVRDTVGVCDLSALSKFEVSGPRAGEFLESLGANSVPRANGKIALTHALTVAAGVASEFTVTRLKDDAFYLTSAAAAERHDEDLLRDRVRGGAEVKVKNVTKDIGVLGVMGPNSRRLLEKICDTDLRDDAFPWSSAKVCTVGGIRVRALRISYVGELGWEFHARIRDLGKLYDSIMDAGKDLDIRPFGTFAINSMRLEKGYRAWGADLTTERTPLEAGLDVFVKPEGREFVGKTALLERARSSQSWRMVLLELAKDTIDAFYGHPIVINDQVVGIVTSGAFGHRVDRSLALAYLRPEARDLEGRILVSILGERVEARILAAPPFDAGNDRPSGRDPRAINAMRLTCDTSPSF